MNAFRSRTRSTRDHPRAGDGPNRRFGGLDGLRALAVLAVLVFHADPSLLPGGFLGVDLFFVISGYLITRLLLGEIGHTGRLGLVRFYARRGLRLLPGLVVVCATVIVAVSLVWRDEQLTLRGSVLSSLGYVGNWWLIDAHQSYFVASGRPPMLQHLWSLAIEEQFYLVWPLVLLALCSYRRRFGQVASLALGLAIASTLAMTVLAVRAGVPYAADSSRVYFGTDTHSMGLLLGAAFGALAERLEFQPRRSWRIRPWFTDLIGLAALGGLGYVVWTVDEFSAQLYRGGFLGVSALAVLAVSTAARPRSVLGLVLDMRPLRWLADRSYSIYLWHWPVVVVTRPGVDLPASRWLADSIRLVLPLLLAAASYRLIEVPVRRTGTRLLRLDAAELRVRLRSLRRQLLVPRLVGMTALGALLVGLVVAPGGSRAPAGAVDLAAYARTGTGGGTPAGSSGTPSASLVTTSISLAPSPVAGPTVSVGSATAPGTTASSGTSTPPGSSVAPRSARPASTPASTPTSTPTRTSASPPPSHPALTAFGDSVLLGAAPAIESAFPNSAVHAVEGQQPYVTLQAVRQVHDAGQERPVVLIHTGNNGILRAGDLRQTLSLLRDRWRVVVLTDRVPMDWQNPNNDTIRSVTRSYANVTLLDWYRVSNGHQEWFYADGLHLRPAGQQAYTALLQKALGR